MLASDVGTCRRGDKMSGAPPRGCADLSAFCWLTMFWKAAWLLAAMRRWVFSSPAETRNSLQRSADLSVPRG